jgi:hypothetical protein
MRSKPLAVLVFVLGIFSRGESAEVAKPTLATAGGKKQIAGPLAGLPSAPGAHIEKIKALGDNEWLKLGAPAPDPKWGVARGRSWCPHLPYAPELKAAFMYGEGVHAFTKPDGRYMDDFFAYDVNANRWICIYPGGDVKTTTLKMDSHGFEVDAEGQPIPVAQMVHAYEQVTYDTDRGRFMFMPCPASHNITVWAERRKLWGGGYASNCSPWMFNAAAGKFELQKTTGPVPTSSYGDILEYVPDLKKVVFLRSGEKCAWLYDPQANTWSNLSPKGPPPPFGIDASACLDTKRDRIYLGGGYYPVAPGANAFWCYDIKSNTWVDLAPKGETCGGSNRFGPGSTVLNYDSMNDVVVLFYHVPEKPEARGIYIYDPATNSWGEKPLLLPLEVANVGQYAICNHGFYSAELDAHFIYTASDSDNNATMWVYRYKRAKK